ncbi:unnamed protein product, partial [Brassica rapa subsp. trilocularis]
MPFETSSKHLFHWHIKPMKWARRVRADCGNKDRIFEFITIFKVAVLLTMAYVFLRVYSEGSSGRVYQCGIPERPLDCEPLYVSEIPLFLIISNFKEDKVAHDF